MGGRFHVAVEGLSDQERGGHVEDVTQIAWLVNSSFGHGKFSQVG
jgi:hypothetical protein